MSQSQPESAYVTRVIVAKNTQVHVAIFGVELTVVILLQRDFKLKSQTMILYLNLNV